MLDGLFSGRAVLVLALLTAGGIEQAGAQTLPRTKGDNLIPIYVGTYTTGKSKGIYLVHLDPGTGQLDQPVLAGEARNPSFVAMHPNGKVLYSVMEGNPPMVGAYEVDGESGTLRKINEEPSGGEAPCHLTVDPTGTNVLVANYVTGQVAVLPLDANGRLRAPSCVIGHEGHGADPQQQASAHAHAVCFDPSGRHLFQTDLGLDKIFSYTLDAGTGKLTPNDPPAVDLTAGSGPRHIAFDAQGKFAYVVSELASTVTVFKHDSQHGTLTAMQTLSTLPKDFRGRQWAAEIAIHPNTRFVYASNRGHGSIASYSRDAGTGLLTYLGDTLTGGEQPRHFAVDPSGRYLIAANQDKDSLETFAVDSQTGALSPVGKSVEVGAPCCVLFAPNAK